MESLEKNQILKDIEQSAKVVKTAAKFTEYSRVYPQTNEFLLSKYKNLENERYQKALVVLASGDQFLNLLMKGIKNFDTFDSNRMTEYYVMGVKIPALLNMTYEQYKKFYKTLLTPKVNEDELFAVIKAADEKYKYFWEEFYRYYRERNGRNFRFNDLFICDLENNYYNEYLYDSKDYQKMQSCLKEATITFRHADIRSVPTTFGQYDFVDLSNILNYYKEIFCDSKKPREMRKKLVTEIVSKNLVENGTLFYDYYLGAVFYKILSQIRTIPVENTDPFSIDCTYGFTLGLTKNKISNL